LALPDQNSTVVNYVGSVALLRHALGGKESNPWGWAGTAGQFLSTPLEVWLDSLIAHHRRLWNGDPAGSQRAAWISEHHTMTVALRACVEALPDEAPEWGVIFEYELPLEGGRRPDVVVLAGRSLVVIEFKSVAAPTQADVDQTNGYLRDLTDYHAGSHGLDGLALLVLESGPPEFAKEVDGVTAVGPLALHRYLFAAHTTGKVDLDEWLDSPYRPLPTLVDAARRIFRNEPLPHVHTAESAGIPETVELLGRVADENATTGGRALAFVTGVPGAGKTLVGLRLVYDRSELHGSATFLSGNGPLVKVLQDALQSRVFVRDLHAFIKTYALNQRRRDPDEHIVVFDEAQRAWDARYMFAKKKVQASEPQLLLGIGERIADWAFLVGLVGEGQEIHGGEESGMAQWAEAAEGSEATWVIHCPPRIAHEFYGLEVEAHEELDLTVTLRSRRAEQLHDWVRLVLTGSLPLASRQAAKMHQLKYPIYLTRSLDDAKEYVWDRFAEEPNKRTGLLASSHAKVLPKHGVDNHFMATSNMNEARWYNAPPDDPSSSNALTQPVTEFGCQGLELDLPIVCWGEDYRWENNAWRMTPVNRQYKQDDPLLILENAYRVLLTRGRDGMVIFVPPGEMFDATEVALLAAGVRLIPTPDELVDVGLSENMAL
jgi:hypothetical protein